MKLINRVKFLGAVIQEMALELTKPHAHSLLFLLSKEYIENNHHYEFIPQPEGPFSIQADADKEVLVKKNLFEKSDNYKPIPDSSRCVLDLDFFEKLAIHKLKSDWGSKSFEELQIYLKNKYPNYFVIQNDEQISETAFFTIGYEGLSPDEYLQKLLSNNVKLLCDVRKNAYSQKFGFSKKELQNSLKKVGIDYLHIPELGIKSEMRKKLDTYDDYKNLFEFYEKEILPNQNQKIDFLIRLMQQHKRIAITCFESKYHECHRSKISDRLESIPSFAIDIKHI